MTNESLERTSSQAMAQPVGGGLRNQRIAVVGLGYVGLPTALSFADQGAEIIGCDVSEGRLTDIKSGRVDLLDRDRARLARHLRGEQFKLTTEPSAISSADAIVICVPTPIDAHQTPDLTALSAACDGVVNNARPGQTVVLTSTTYVGCTRDLLVRSLQASGLKVGDDIFVAFSPERIDPGVATHAPETTPRVVGGLTSTCTSRAVDILRHTASAMHRVSSPEAAEMTKLLENSFRAVNIAMANEFCSAAEELNVDIVEVIRAAATKPYGFMPFYPGAGAGGHCIPCDPHYLLWQLRARRISSPLMQTAMTAIVTRPREVVAQARRMLGESGCRTRGARVLILGVTYKPGVADTRESPALEILDQLASAGARVAYSDPLIDYLETPYAGCLSSERNPEAMEWDLVVIHTLHATEDYEWLIGRASVLDTTYRIGDLIGRRLG
nr:nucleotide sugar dehydrogenase [Mycobacterium sp. JS623]